MIWLFYLTLISIQPMLEPVRYPHCCLPHDISNLKQRLRNKIILPLFHPRLDILWL